MKVSLIDYPQDALALLLYTKNTRLMGAETLDDIRAWPEEKKLEHLAYMRDTIQSSWEFVGYTFHIEGVTRAFTHQLVRTRTGSYAQQSQRTVDVREMEVKNTVPRDPGGTYVNADRFSGYAAEALERYAKLVDDGVPVQDARGLLPTNIETEIIARFDLRTLHNMALVRLCTRTQGEYQDVFRAMRAEVVKVHPWAADFIKVQCAWNGSCAFPRYTECPANPLTYNTAGRSAYEDGQSDERLFPEHEAVLADIESRLANTAHVANPVVKNGRTM